MKKLLLLLAVFSLTSVLGLQAQSCKYSKMKTKQTAAKAAAMDASIVTLVDAETGKKQFARKKVCAASGKVSYTDVEFCKKTKRFTSTASSRTYSCSKSKKAALKATAPLKAACLKAKQKTEKIKRKQV